MPRADAWQRVLSDLRTYKRDGRQAVHKPLMLLLLLARAGRGASADVSYAEIDRDLPKLLREFGPPRGRQQAELPFWHLQREGVWAVRDADRIPLRKGGRNPTRRMLLSRDATGHVPPEYWSAIAEDPALRADLARRILWEFWPPTLHEPIRQAIGLPEVALARDRETVTRARRDCAFRDLVFETCGAQCGVCGYDGRLSGDALALEAAHLMWHCRGGPDDPSNGLVLCSLHHVALDRGAIGFDDSLRVTVSPHVEGNRVDAWLRRFAGEPLVRFPEAPPIQARFVSWHRRWVYRR